MRVRDGLLLVCVITVAVVSITGYDMAKRLGIITSSAAALALPVFTSKCVGKPVSYPVPARPIVLFGDSISAGYGATHRCLPLYLRSILPVSAHVLHTGDTSYPGDLARMLHVSVLDYGVGKEVTSDGLPRLQSLLHTVHPSTVVILEGINDLWGGRNAGAIVGNLSMMARSVRSSGARPIILNLLPVDRPVFPEVQTSVHSLDTLIRAMTERNRYTLVDASAQFSRQHRLSTLYRHPDGREDGVHPNDRGYVLLAQIVAQAIR